jgi:hypothetical protein
MATQAQITKPETGTPFVAEVADMLFATKSLSKISKGQGSWGDLLNVGVTAATFVVLPAKLAILPVKALNAVIKASGKVVSSDVASVAAKNAAAKTLDDALTIKRQGYVPTGTEPVERVGRAGMGEPTPPYQVAERTAPTAAAKAEKGLPDKKYTRTSDEEYDPFKRDVDIEEEAADAINASRTSYKEAPAPGTPKGSAEELTTKYVANPKRTKEQKERALIEDARKADMYDKAKFTDEEIEDRIAGLSKKQLDSPELKRQVGESDRTYRQRLEEYVRGGAEEFRQVPPVGRVADETSSPVEFVLRRVRSGEYTDAEIKKSVDTFRRYVREPSIEKDAKQVTDLYLAARRMLKDAKIDSKLVPEDRRISRQDLKVIKESFGQLKKEFKEKVVDTAEGKALLKKIEKEMPAEPKSKDVLLRYEENLMDDAKPGELKAFVDEAVNDTPITPTVKGPTRTKNAPVRLKTKIPDDLIKSYSFDDDLAKHNLRRAAALLAEKSRLNAFNAKNSTKLKTETNQKEISKLKQSSARNKKIIDRINDELRRSRKILSREEQIEAQNIADEVTKRNLAKRKEKFNPEGKKYVEGVAPVRVKPAQPGKGGETAKLTTRGKIAKAKAEVEKLREEWKNTPASDTEARSRLAKEAKKFADYIKKLEGK